MRKDIVIELSYKGFVIFGDNFVIFGDIIPYPDFEAIQPVRRSYLPHTY